VCTLAFISSYVVGEELIKIKCRGAFYYTPFHLSVVKVMKFEITFLLKYVIFVAVFIARDIFQVQTVTSQKRKLYE
jgi:hypothetical protein